MVLVSEFTKVVSSTGLDFEPHAGNQTVCPRILLGHSCINNDGYDCLCQQVECTETYGTKNDRNEVSILTVQLNLIPHVGNPQSVMAGVDLMGYRAHFQASKDAVVATFNLKKAENLGLNEFVNEVGI